MLGSKRQASDLTKIAEWLRSAEVPGPIEKSVSDFLWQEECDLERSKVEHMIRMILELYADKLDEASIPASISAQCLAMRPTKKVWRSMSERSSTFEDTVKNLLKAKPKPHSDEKKDGYQSGSGRRPAKPSKQKD